MLRARCLSAVARMAFPDSIGGMYSPDELGASVRVEGETVVFDGETVIDATARVVDAGDAISLDALTKLAQRRNERGLTAEDLLYLAVDQNGVERLEELTVEQGRALYRLIDKASDAELAERLRQARAVDAEIVDLPDEHADLLAGFEASHPRQPNPMFA
jgi:hypothetical protein